MTMSDSGRPPLPRLEKATEYGNSSSFWVEYPSGLIDLTRTHHLSQDSSGNEPTRKHSYIDIPVDGDRTVRVNPSTTAYVVIDMQNYFLHPEIRNHPTGLACVDPILKMLGPLRSKGVKILWVNWGLTEHELQTIPPALVRGFQKGGRGGFGSEMPGHWGRLLMRDEQNAKLYGPLQEEYAEGNRLGTDAWIHKNRMSGLWGPQSALDLYLQESGITTLLFGGVNADQCVSGTIVDSYFRGYDVLLVKDTAATSSPDGGYENVVYNVSGSYGFTTDSNRVLLATKESI